MKAVSRQIRTNKAKATVALIEREILNKDKNVILLGDFNDFPRRKKNNTLYPILSNQDLIFLTHDVKSCRFAFSYTIDNIVITKGLSELIVPNSLRSYDIKAAYPDYLSKSISDHCPVSISFKTTTAN
jgi:endonuclease/exonuclease/phosphatase family metal-dependent hydrolase